MQTSLYKLTMLAAAAVFVVACGGGGSDDSAGNDGGGANPTPTATPTLTPTQAPDAPLEPEHKINPVQFGSDKLCATTTASELEASDAAEYYDFAATKALDSAKLHQYFSQQSPDKNTGQMREIAANPTSPAADEWFAQLGEIRDIHLVAAAQKEEDGSLFHPRLWFSSTPDKETARKIDLQLLPGQSYYSAQIDRNWALNNVIAKQPETAIIKEIDSPLKNPKMLRYIDDSELRRRLPNTYCFHRGEKPIYFFEQPNPALGLSCLYLKDNGSWITFWVKGEADDQQYSVNIERINTAQQAALENTDQFEFNWLWVSKTRQQLAQHIDKIYETNKFAKIDRSKTLTPYQEYMHKINEFHGPLAMYNYKLEDVTFTAPKTECTNAPVFN